MHGLTLIKVFAKFFSGLGGRDPDGGIDGRPDGLDGRLDGLDGVSVGAGGA